MRKKFEETSIPELYATILNKKAYSYTPNHTDKMANILFSGSALLLKEIKVVDTPVAVLFENVKGETLFAIVCKYLKGTEGSVAGSWSLTVSFDDNDWADGKVTRAVDKLASTFFTDFAHAKYGMSFYSVEVALTMITDLAAVLTSFLDDNANMAKAGEPYEVIIQDIAELKIEFDGKDYFKSIEIMPEVKQLIKDDERQ